MLSIEATALLQATGDTIYMVFIASLLSLLGGLMLGLLLFLTRATQPFANRCFYQGLSLIVNITRSVPFIILMISVLPLTRWLVGTTIGLHAAIVPLTLSAIPFFARICENTFVDIPASLLETAAALGVTTRQLISKILLPESLPALIRGGTLTIIALIGYSAMAGVVGGGGLGELAINYGYQRFNLAVTVETVVILVFLVMGIQWIGDYLAKKRSLMGVAIVAVTLSFFCVSYAWQSWVVTATHTIRVGVMTGWPEEVMRVAKQIAQKHYHLTLKIIAFNDYVLPNVALANGNIDANIFQHEPYLQAQIQSRRLRLVAIGKTFVYPMGFYSLTIHQLSDLPNGATVAIPNDPSNEARALLLLQKARLITLRSRNANDWSIRDIVSNPKRLKLIALDAALLPRALQDATLVALTNDYIGVTHQTLQDALLKETADSPYANVIVVRRDDRDNAELKTLVAVMHSPAVRQITEQLFPNGAAIPAT